MIGRELAGYASGDDSSGIAGGEDGIAGSRDISDGKWCAGAFLKCLRGVSEAISSSTAQFGRR